MKFILSKTTFVMLITIVSMHCQLCHAQSADVTGDWKYTYENNKKSGDLILTQTGNEITGTGNDWDGNTYVVNGSINDNYVTYTLTSAEGKVFTFSGSVKDNKMSCKYTGPEGKSGESIVTKQ